MAKYIPEGVPMLGTFGNVTIYEWGGAYFARRKSSLTRKRVLKAKEFAGTRRHAANMGLASKIASAIYHTLPVNIKGRWIFRALVGEAASLLYKGMEEGKVRAVLQEKYTGETGTGTATERRAEGRPRSRSVPVAVSRQLRKHFLERWEQQGWPRHYFKGAWSYKGSFHARAFYDSERWAWGEKRAKSNIAAVLNLVT